MLTAIDFFFFLSISFDSNHTRDLVRMGTSFYDDFQSTPEQREADLERLSKCTWAFVRSMKRHLSPEWEDEEDFKAELFQRLEQQRKNDKSFDPM